MPHAGWERQPDACRLQCFGARRLGEVSLHAKQGNICRSSAGSLGDQCPLGITSLAQRNRQGVGDLLVPGEERIQLSRKDTAASRPAHPRSADTHPQRSADRTLSAPLRGVVQETMGFGKSRGRSATAAPRAPPPARAAPPAGTPLCPAISPDNPDRGPESPP